MGSRTKRGLRRKLHLVVIRDTQVPAAVFAGCLGVPVLGARSLGAAMAAARVQGVLGARVLGSIFGYGSSTCGSNRYRGTPTKLTLQAGTGQAKMVEAKMREPRPDVAGAGIRQLLWVVSLRFMKIL